MVADARRAWRVPYTHIEDGTNAYLGVPVDAARTAALRAAAKAWGVTFNDLLLACLLQALSPLAARRRGAPRRNRLAVASILNMRRDLRPEARDAVSPFLAAFRVSHTVPEGIGLQQLAQDVQRQTSNIKRNHLYLQSLLALGLSALLWPLLTPLQRFGFYPKHFAVWAGITALDLNPLWGQADAADTAGLDYLRAVPTGPLCPLVLAVTSVHDQLHLGFAFRTSAFSREAVDALAAAMLRQADALRAAAVAVSRWLLWLCPGHRAGAGRLRQRAGGRAGRRRVAASADRGPQAVLGALALDLQLEARILALDPERVSDSDVREVLALRADAAHRRRCTAASTGAPADGVVLAFPGRHGLSVAQAQASRRRTSVAQPLREQPADRRADRLVLRARGHDADDGRPQPGRHPAGEGAARPGRRWRDADPGVEPANRRGRAAHDDRRSLYRHAQRPVVGLKIGYASVVASGGAALLLPNQWSMVRRLRTIPDTVDEFTGYALAVDLVAWDMPGAGAHYQATGVPQGAQCRAAGATTRMSSSRRPRTWRATRRCATGSTPTSRISPRQLPTQAPVHRQQPVGSRCLVSHQEALGAGSPEGGARAARPGPAQCGARSPSDAPARRAAMTVRCRTLRQP